MKLLHTLLLLLLTLSVSMLANAQSTDATLSGVVVDPTGKVIQDAQIEIVNDAKRIGIDATTLEANAAMKSIVRRDTGESYNEFLTGLARESGIETPTREDLARLDRKREKRTSNKEWKSPTDGDARIAKMKDGSTHLAHKAEHAVDMESGAVVAITLG